MPLGNDSERVSLHAQVVRLPGTTDVWLATLTPDQDGLLNMQGNPTPSKPWAAFSRPSQLNSTWRRSSRP
ncbi:hypothetical protein ACFSC4_28995 [Deinococcus malanensis]|uniref:hypothetical protein n=1 Tax=Deinococcus malanensis TaxID=1706855 RepID=UPI00362924BD